MKNTAKSLDAIERRNRVLALRAAGATYEQIASECDYKDASGPRKVMERALKEIRRESVKELVELELQRLDMMWSQVWGLIVREPGEGSVDLRALDRALRIMERRAKLLGLDAPAHYIHTGEDNGPIKVVMSEEERVARVSALMDTARERAAATAFDGDRAFADEVTALFEAARKRQEKTEKERQAKGDANGVGAST